MKYLKKTIDFDQWENLNMNDIQYLINKINNLKKTDNPNTNYLIWLKVNKENIYKFNFILNNLKYPTISEKKHYLNIIVFKNIIKFRLDKSNYFYLSFTLPHNKIKNLFNLDDFDII